MTREEAINIMKVIVHMLEEKYDTDRVEDAVEMAIQALEQEPCEDATLKDIFCMGCEYKEQEPCEDAISRQAVLIYIEFILTHGMGKKKSFEFIKKYVEKQPSVNPVSNISIQITEREKYGRFN